MRLVDAHVHRHECFAPERFLDAAASNIAAAAWRAGGAPSTPGMLLFTHAAGEDAFGGLQAGSVGRWSLATTQEPVSLCAQRAAAPPLTLVGGRQIASAEGLEVLALGAVGPFADGVPVAVAIEAVLEQGGVPVIPWGFGKWWRERGAIVRRLVADRARFPLLFVGDNAGRPGTLARPRLFAEAERLGRPVLPGTDPLPLPGELDKVGRLVFRVDRPLSTDKPFTELRHWLERCTASPPAVGVYEGMGMFLRRQVEIRLANRRAAP